MTWAAANVGRGYPDMQGCRKPWINCWWRLGSGRHMECRHCFGCCAGLAWGWESNPRGAVVNLPSFGCYYHAGSHGSSALDVVSLPHKVVFPASQLYRVYTGGSYVVAELCAHGMSCTWLQVHSFGRHVTWLCHACRCTMTCGTTAPWASVTAGLPSHLGLQDRLQQSHCLVHQVRAASFSSFTHHL